ncbi:50S ribosomal protein L25 [Candidatus Gracilibacteria bacterium]|nr:50S ribosomal protein L25 [Candidatus Gracilibacteria bacterium]
MADKLLLDVQNRVVIGKKVKDLRKQGLLPVTVYGKGVGPFSVQVEARAFQAVYRQAGRTRLIEVSIPGQARQSVFVHDVQRHPVTRNILHADLWAVDLKAEMTAEVPVTTVGDSLLIARGDAMINIVLQTLTIHALPANIPQHIEIDVSVLDELGKQISVADLASSKDYKILDDPEQVIISLTETRTGTEEPSVEETPVEPELIRKDRAEGDGE